jgi:serine/threonine-protein kinase
LTTPSSVVRDLDPAIERVILRCLERDAALRPGSALAVAAALPGGDPLAAALAAGETPSPEMVAAAGEASAFSPAIGLSLFAAVIAGLLAMAVLSDRVVIAAMIPMEKSVEALEDHAREILAKLGSTEKPQDTARGFLPMPDYLLYVLRTDRSATRWSGLSNPYFPTLRFWYRTSPRDLEPNALLWRPAFDDPPMNVTNMRMVVTDIAGHLTQFTMVPPQREDERTASAPPQAPMNWTLFFDAAGLDMGTFKPVPSTWVPNSYADERKAWEGPMPGRPDITLHADAASYRGQPAFFQIAGPWSRTLRQTQEVPQGRSVIRFLQFLIVFGLSIGTCVLARRNYVSGRGDRRGATRVAAAWLVFYFASWLLGARFWLEPLTEFTHFLREYAAAELLEAAIIWLIYMALEPYVRRYSADILMSWSRLLSGRLRDPRVGRDILVGIVAGLTIAIVGPARLSSGAAT